MPRALITGITGQDGSYLAELLLEKGYEVHGLERRVAIEDQTARHGRIAHIADRIQMHIGTIEDPGDVHRAVERSQSDECYHLAAQSDVALSFKAPEYTMRTNVMGTLNVLDCLRRMAPACRFYFAGSSEMFGKVDSDFQNEYTPFHPRSPYGISKVAGFHLTRNYREAYDMFACSGIAFNHESPRRGYEFVTRKIVNHVANQALGNTRKPLIVGNLDAERDWGAAWEYTKGMWLMLQQDEPTDLVIATGEKHSVREFIEATYATILGVDQTTWTGDGKSETGRITMQDTCGWSDLSINRVANIPNPAIEVSPKFYRPADVHTLCGDNCKAQTLLGWMPMVRFKELVKVMCEAELKELSGIDHQ